MPGRLGTSPMAMLTGTVAGVEFADAPDHMGEVGAQRAFPRVLHVHDIGATGDGGTDLGLIDHADE